MTIYYSDGGPGPAQHLLRVNTESTDPASWSKATADKWTVAYGWEPSSQAQPDIMFLGEYFPLPAEEVPKVQEAIRDSMRQYGPLPPVHA